MGEGVYVAAGIYFVIYLPAHVGFFYSGPREMVQGEGASGSGD